MSRRVVSLLLVAATLVAAAVVDRRQRPALAGAAGSADAMPTAAAPSAPSSTWFCAGATATPDGPADGTLIVANPTDRALKGTATFVPDDPKAGPRTVAVEVGPWSRTGIAYRDVLQAAWVSVLVELDGGGAVVEHSVSGPRGADVAPCATSASDVWYFADGGTTRDALLVYALYNPFPEDAIVDLSFVTEQGRVVPQALQGIVVPARRMVAVNVGEQVIRRKAVSGTVHARGGRVVAERIQTYDGSEGRDGLALVPGAPSTGTEWWFPEGYVSDGIIERYQFYNPSSREARVTVTMTLERGEAEPFELAIPPRGRFTLKANDEQRIPKNVGHAAAVVSDNGVGVVVERSVDAAKPAGRTGLASTMGARRAATRWVFAAGVANKGVDEWIVLQNTGDRPGTASLRALASGQPLALDGLQDVPIPAHGRVAIRLGDHVQRDDLGLRVDATVPVVAERGLYRVGRRGMSIVPGVPLS